MVLVLGCFLLIHKNSRLSTVKRLSGYGEREIMFMVYIYTIYMWYILMFMVYIQPWSLQKPTLAKDILAEFKNNSR